MVTPSDEMIEAVLEYTLPIRMAKGHDEGKFQTMLATIRKFHMFYANTDAIPKVAANVFVDFFPALHGCLSMYSDAEREVLIHADALAYEEIMNGL